MMLPLPGLRFVSVVALVVGVTQISFAQLPAFPGAVGYGSPSEGGRGGAVLFVTNLNNSGPGSLRDACEATGRRMVLFRTGGTININDPIDIEDPFITIAGQTAPGGGICIK